MRHPLHLALILALMLTGIGLGAARGTVMSGGQVVLCTGHGVVLIDDPNAPDRPAFCPDMALSLLAAIAVPPVDVAPLRVMARLTFAPPPVRTQGRDSPTASARDPPFRQDFPAKPV